MQRFRTFLALSGNFIIFKCKFLEFYVPAVQCL